AEDISRLFVEFQQLDASAAKKYQGTGLGLALTRRVVEAQGGTIGVDSAYGKGSTFFAVLPRVHAAGSDHVPARVEHAWAADVRALRVLVVDDDNADRAWLSKTLEAAGYSVDAVATRAEAIGLCRE